ncbi:hypothetical protein I4U23_020200 [Adineta vaga]|nr:hypothetical protein I4U23_020200 [Adineta vaga]
MHNRFVSSTLSEIRSRNQSPIYGYQHLEITSLEQAVDEIKLIVPGLEEYVHLAKRNCNRKSSVLTWDESAAIYLYSMPIPFFSLLNKYLRVENRNALKPWFGFLKLFMTALEKLSSYNNIAWRGVACDFGSGFSDGNMQIWWRELGTIFTIETTNARDITIFSTFQDEQEVILMPGSCIRMLSKPLNFKNSLFIVHLKEEDTSSRNKESSSTIQNSHSTNTGSLYDSNTSNPTTTTTTKRSDGDMHSQHNVDNDRVRQANNNQVASTQSTNVNNKISSIGELRVALSLQPYVFDPITMQLSLIQCVRLQQKETQYVSCTCSSEKFFVVTVEAYYPYYLYAYTLPGFTFLSRLTVKDLIGSEPLPTMNCDRIWSTTEHKKDERKIIRIQYNQQRLGILIHAGSHNFLYALDLLAQPIIFNRIELPWDDGRLLSLVHSGEWLVIHDIYEDKVIQIALDCQFKTEWSSKKYSQESFFSLSTGFVGLEGSVNNAVMFRSSYLILLLDQSLAMYIV